MAAGMNLPTYLTGVSNPSVRAVAKSAGLGLLVTPDTHYEKQVALFPTWAADNACFAHADSFDTAAYLGWLDSFPARERARCLFATAPDVLCDPRATLERSAPVLPEIRRRGYKVALVAQDGLENLQVPWWAFDALFLGGSTEWKLSDGAKQLTRDAKLRGKHVHMGRVNSRKRLHIAGDFGCDTVDGTFLRFGPKVNLPRLLSWYDGEAIKEAA